MPVSLIGFAIGVVPGRRNIRKFNTEVFLRARETFANAPRGQIVKENQVEVPGDPVCRQKPVPYRGSII